MPANSKSKKATMRVANIISAGALCLASCQKPIPDFRYMIPSQDSQGSVTVSGFQPRGTIDGYVVLSFNKKDNTDSDVATIQHINDGIIGWTSDGKVAVIGNKIGYRGISSEYSPDGTVKSEINLVLCSRDVMDCTSIESRISKGRSSKRIADFPES